MKRRGPIRILIVDHSPAFRTGVTNRLRTTPDVQVCAAVFDVEDARQAVLAQRPDVIVLDLELPRGDTLDLLQRLRRFYPVPVFVVSSGGAQHARQALRAVELGALEVLVKPAATDRTALCAFARELAEKIRIADARAYPVRSTLPARALRPPAPQPFRSAGLQPEAWVVVIGASTGGTEALRALLARTPADFPPTVIVQHMPSLFTRPFAERLNAASQMQVAEATGGDSLAPGLAFVARGDTHLIVERRGGGWQLRYTHQTPVNRHCPSVNVLFESAAAAVGAQAVGVLLTGMGADGAAGLLRLRERGAITIGQDQQSAAIYGMPKVALQIGAVQVQAAPAEMPELIRRLLQKRGSPHGPAGRTAVIAPQKGRG